MEHSILIKRTYVLHKFNTRWEQNLLFVWPVICSSVLHHVIGSISFYSELWLMFVFDTRFDNLPIKYVSFPRTVNITHLLQITIFVFPSYKLYYLSLSN